MKSFVAIAALAALVKAQDASTLTVASSVLAEMTEIPANPADALDFAGIEAVPEPSYTEVPGLTAQVISYASATAISSAAAAVTEDPLTVYPAATDVAMNAAGESDDGSSATTTAALEKRGLAKRTACAAQPAISNTYSVDVTSYKNFKADANITRVASNAETPQGYWRNFKNLQGASSAYAYMGYSQLTAYNTTYCANKCTKMTGCLAFNIYFERDPVVEPGTTSAGTCPDGQNSTNPEAFANIKCSYWGSQLDNTTANNYGQWRANFQVGIAGSNAYTSYAVGGPVDGCATPLSLNNAVMNAPLRDCQTTWTYMGYKLFTSGPYDPNLCKAACDAQSAYDTAHPPNGGSPAICAGFGSYVLTKTNSSGSYPQGQMCTMYTSGWGKQYAVNTASYDDSVGAKYTYSLSYFYNLTNVQPDCSVPVVATSVAKSRLFRL